MFLSLMFPTQHPTWDTLDSEVEGRGRAGESCVSTWYAGFYLYRAYDLKLLLYEENKK